jgi:hypothetical protein
MIVDKDGLPKSIVAILPSTFARQRIEPLRFVTAEDVVRGAADWGEAGGRVRSAYPQLTYRSRPPAAGGQAKARRTIG